MIDEKGRSVKRLFDISMASLGLVLFSPVIVAAWIVARIDTGVSGIFVQRRIGMDGEPFDLYKIRTMRPSEGTTVTTAGDSRITVSGRLLRRYKIDELPQLWNVLKGDMSLVGPRPDVEGYADRLEGDERIVLSVRPGITGPASLKYRNEEEILASVDDPVRYNDEVIWPDKVKMNMEYIREWSFGKDIGYIVATVTGREVEDARERSEGGDIER